MSVQDDGDYKTFAVRYRYAGAEWGLQIPAQSFEDAKARLNMMAWGHVDGVIIATLPAFIGPLAAVIVACRNALNRLFDPHA